MCLRYHTVVACTFLYSRNGNFSAQLISYHYNAGVMCKPASLTCTCVRSQGAAAEDDLEEEELEFSDDEKASTSWPPCIHARGIFTLNCHQECALFQLGTQQYIRAQVQFWPQHVLVMHVVLNKRTLSA